MKVCHENPNLVKIKQKYQALLPEHLAHFIFLAVTCRATIHGTYCCVYMAILLIFNILVKRTSANETYKANSFLDLHGNSVMQTLHNVISTLLPIFIFKLVQ
jgi:hypothetical protein